MPEVNAGQAADDLIAREIAGQDAMWGRSNERADSSRGQLLSAGLAIRPTGPALIAAGADTTRKSRDVAAQPYTKDQPAVQL